MIVQWFLVVLLIPQAQPACIKNRIRLWDPTKCEAGRTYFAKLSTIPELEYVSQPYLYPWLAELKISQRGRVKSCTGALINDRYVLTAQNCVFPPIQPHQVTVHVGFFNGYDKDVSEIFQPRILERKAAYFILYPDYDPYDLRTVANNLALVKLSEPVKYSKTIYPVQLPAPGDKFKDYTNEVAENVEWSYFPSYGAESKKKLKENVVRILKSEQCSDIDNKYNQVIASGVFCTVDSGNGVRPCGEEHAGLLTIPLSRRTYNITTLVGIAAWEPSLLTSCQDIPPPRVYVRLADKLLWIKEHTGDSLYCKY